MCVFVSHRNIEFLRFGVGLELICFRTMGCELTKLVGSTRDGVKSAGGIDSGPGAGAASAAAPALDPRLPLNARQKYSMLASWKGISRALEPTGIYMFIK